MNLPLIWIGIPLITAMVLLILRQHTRLVLGLGIFANVALALFAFLLPSGNNLNLGGVLIPIQESMGILGRRFVLTGGDRPFVGMLFGLGGFWFVGSTTGKTHRYFVPLGLMMMAFLVAALAVEPFLYAAMLVETAVLISVPLLYPPGSGEKGGVLRFLVFQTLAMPFILLAGVSANAVELNPADPQLLERAVFLLALGFAFWLAIFPFYNWMPLLFSQTNPFVASFVILLLNTLVFMLGLDFLNAFAWLREFQLLYTALRLIGTIMIVTGGVWALFQQELPRNLSYAMIVDNGFSLLALSLNNRVGLEIFLGIFPARFLTMALFSLSLAIFAQKGPLTLHGMRGMLHKYPLASAGLVFGMLGCGGFPLLAIFPMRLTLLENLAQISTNTVIWAMVGSICLLASGLRVLDSLVSDEERTWQVGESGLEAFLMISGILMILAIGVFPRWLLPGIERFIQVFSQLL